MKNILQDLSQKGALVNIRYIAPRKGPITIWGRILEVKEDVILVYNVDQSSVVNISIHQIDEIN
ncbi:hypothetical protein GCM10011391_39060 [Pullulanibacillus camelliae]|uniref:Uncharacterized protein n=1 Tax=Pullulanibacillus camelliae TaxID=1707096 RepID=A0A8J2YNZ5_9BACL|nr:hypothetical protein [Pullulanibacillus camelliae]GGE56277.1 hypothetical protein GCM10011391_39060 [Pullulanibacillus camelliae]